MVVVAVAVEQAEESEVGEVGVDAAAVSAEVVGRGVEVEADRQVGGAGAAMGSAVEEAKAGAVASTVAIHGLSKKCQCLKMMSTVMRTSRTFVCVQWSGRRDTLLLCNIISCTNSSTQTTWRAYRLHQASARNIRGGGSGGVVCDPQMHIPLFNAAFRQPRASVPCCICAVTRITTLSSTGMQAR